MSTAESVGFDGKRRRTPKQPIPPDLRWQVWERDDFTCHYCDSQRRLSVDHKVPESEGGATELENLVTACASCNSRKGTLSYEDFCFQREVVWAFGYLVARQGSVTLDDPTVREMMQLAQTRVLLKTAPQKMVNVVRIDPATGMPEEYWINPKRMTAQHFAEAIQDRRRRGLHRQADRFAATAIERFGVGAIPDPEPTANGETP